PHLGDRSDQLPALFTVVNPQIAVPELELVQVHFHAVRLHLLGGGPYLVLRRYPEDSAGFPRRITDLPSPLVLRVTGQDSRYSRNDHESFRGHRVLRDIPGHSRQRRWSIRWRRR